MLQTAPLISDFASRTVLSWLLFIGTGNGRARQADFIFVRRPRLGPKHIVLRFQIPG